MVNDLGCDLAATLPDLRAQAESMMLDQCVIERADGMSDPDPVTLEVSQRWVQVWSGKCRVQRRTEIVQPGVAGDASLPSSTIELHVPVDGTGKVTAGDGRMWRARIVDARLDPSMVGMILTITGGHAKTFATARRLPCVAVEVRQ